MFKLTFWIPRNLDHTIKKSSYSPLDDCYKKERDAYKKKEKKERDRERKESAKRTSRNDGIVQGCTLAEL